VAFLAKAAMWPLNFWLVPAYAAASGPSAAVFALLTKVGVYVLLRLSTLLFSPQAGASAGFGGAWLLWGGRATLAAGALGLLGAQRPARLAAYAAIVSSGTLMAVLGLARPELTAGALVYLPGSTFAVAAFFLLAELMDRSRDPDPAAMRAPEDEEDRLPFALAEQELSAGTNLDDEQKALVGRAIPASTALLALAFVACTLLLAGLPPLAGFIGKFAMLSALLQPAHIGASRWLLLALVMASGLSALVALSRCGMLFFWSPVGRAAPRLRAIEVAPIALLLAACVLITVQAEALTRFAGATARALHQPRDYIDAVFAARPLPSPTRAQRAQAPAPGAPK
jgi:multicomponent K+:H+ antiporter subunit D